MAKRPSKSLPRLLVYVFLGYLGMQSLSPSSVLAGDDYGGGFDGGFDDGFNDDFDSSPVIVVDPGPSMSFPDSYDDPWDDGYYYDYMPAPSGVGVVIIPGTQHRGSKVGNHPPKAPRVKSGSGAAGANTKNRKRARSDASQTVTPAFLIPLLLCIHAVI